MEGHIVFDSFIMFFVFGILVEMAVVGFTDMVDFYSFSFSHLIVLFAHFTKISSIFFSLLIEFSFFQAVGLSSFARFVAKGFIDTTFFLFTFSPFRQD